MNILNKVTFKSLLKNKTRTIATIIGIMLSAALMCTVTGAVSSFMGTLYENAIYRAGYWNFYSQEMSAKHYNEVMKAPSIKETKYSQVLGFSNSLEQSGSANLKILGTSGNFAEESMAVHITGGEYPASNKEILLPTVYSYSTDIKIGDKLTLDIGDRMLNGENINYEPHDDQEYLEVHETREYTVTGFYEPGTYSPINYFFTPALTLADDGMPEEYVYDFYLIYKNPRLYGIPSDEFYYVPIGGYPNNTLYDALGRGNSFFSAVLIAAVAVILVGVGSVSLIYNAFSISVSERTKLFGLLSSVGASKKQIRRTVIAEAIMVSLVGIPLGVAAGIGIVVGSIEYLTYMFGAELGESIGLDVPFTTHINGWALGTAVVISLLTVLISAWIPSKRATKISAIEAIHMTTEISDKQIKTSPITDKLFGLSGTLASKYYKRSKKRYRTTIISLVFSIVLFIVTSGFSDIFMEAVFYNSFSYGYDVSARLYSYPFSDDKTPDDLLKTFESADGVTNAAYTVTPNWYGYHNDFRIRTENVSQRAQEKHWLTDYSYYVTGSRSDWLYGYSNLVFVDDGSFKELLRDYDLDEAVFMDPDDPLAVVIDGNRSYDSETGRYITKKILDQDNNVLYGYYFDEEYIEEEYGYWNDEAYDENGECTLNFYRHNATGEMEKANEIPVDCYVMKTGKVIYDLPYFIDDNYSHLTIIYPISLAEKIYEGFADIEPDSYYFLSDDHAACVKTVENILGSNENYINDYAGQQQDARNVIVAASIVMYIFVAIIALISVTNVFNTITTNINLRRREFAMLKSIGMTSNGFNGMMNFECVLYGAKSLLYGLPISLVILVILNLLMAQGYDMPFSLPWLAIFITIAGVFAAVFVTMMYALTKVKKASPIDELKNENI